jgi:hypothetical protein
MAYDVSCSDLELGVMGKWGSGYENPPHILGAQLTERYPQILRTEGLLLVGEQSDEGDHPYYLISKPWSPTDL